MTASAPSIELDGLLEQAARPHKHLCPRQVLGVRMGLLAAEVFAGLLPQTDKRILAIVETDGCFADGVGAATGCSMGRRTMRLADEGKIAAVFIDTRGQMGSQRAVRLFALPDLRTRAMEAAPEAANRWRAYLDAYRRLPAEVMFGQQQVRLNFDLAALISKPAARTACACCGEEILNQRERIRGSETLCRTCAGEGYWSLAGSPHSGSSGLATG